MSRLAPAAVAAMLLAFPVPAAAAQEPPVVSMQVPARLVPVSADPDWVEFSATEMGRGFFDRRSVRGGDGRVRMAVRIDHAANRFGIVESFNAWEIDCAPRTFRVVEFDLFGEGGALILSHVNSLEDSPWQPIVVDSPAGGLHRDHC